MSDNCGKLSRIQRIANKAGVIIGENPIKNRSEREFPYMFIPKNLSYEYVTPAIFKNKIQDKTFYIGKESVENALENNIFEPQIAKGRNINDIISIIEKYGLEVPESIKQMKQNMTESKKIIVTKNQLIEMKAALLEAKILKEDPDSLEVTDDRGYTTKIVRYDDPDALAFGVKDGKMYVGYCPDITNKDIERKVEVEVSNRNVLKTHDDIKDFYYVLFGDGINGEYDENLTRYSMNFPGRLWLNCKVISFWKCPSTNQLTGILIKLTKEIRRIYNYDVNFSDYRIESRERGQWKTELIPIKKFVNGTESSDEDISKMHLLPSDEKRNTSQMKNAKNADNELLANKFDGNISQAEWNDARNKYRGESKKILVTKDQLNEMKIILSEATASEIHSKFYSEIPDDDFNKIVAAGPISSNLERNNLGEYGKWMLNLYKKNNLKLEDLYKATEYITIFDKAKKAKKLDNNDINRFKTLPELFSVVEPFTHQESISNNDITKDIKTKEADVVYEDSEWKVIVPKTEKAACLYGANTQWCTAAKENNMFDNYNSKGPLYININKQTGIKYQFHLETNSFMDEKDEQINLKSIGLTSGLINYYLSKPNLNALTLIYFGYDIHDIPIESIQKISDEQLLDLMSYGINEKDLLFVLKYINFGDFTAADFGSTCTCIYDFFIESENKFYFIRNIGGKILFKLYEQGYLEDIIYENYLTPQEKYDFIIERLLDKLEFIPSLLWCAIKINKFDYALELVKDKLNNLKGRDVENAIDNIYNCETCLIKFLVIIGNNNMEDDRDIGYRLYKNYNKNTEINDILIKYFKPYRDEYNYNNRKTESKKILITSKQLNELRNIIKEEKQLDKLTLPKFISNSIKQHKTSLGEHPTFPPGDENTFEERLLLKRFNEVGRAVGKISDLEQYDKNYLISKLTDYISKAKSIESNIREDLEKICYEYVCEQFGLSNGELDIECLLKDTIKPDKQQNVEPLILDDVEFGEVSEMDDLGKEIYKRRVIDSLIQGAAVRLSSDYSTILNKVYELNPKLPELYYNIIALNDYLTFVKEINPDTNNLGGYVSVNLSSTDPKITSEAIIFPVLVFETIKGVMELMSSHGLPDNRRDAEYVIGKADFLLAENWDKRFGVGLYDLFSKLVKDKKLLPEIFVELISLDVDQFNNRMKEIFAGTRKGKSFVDHLEREIEREQGFSSIESILGESSDDEGSQGEDEDFTNTGDGEGEGSGDSDFYFEAADFNVGSDEDGYFSINELGGIINDEAVALGNIGDFTYDMPAFGDKESLNHKDMIKNGQAKWNIRENIFYHGSPSGDLRGSFYGLHIGTFEAAKQALEARIGVPAQGEWDGTREYGETKLAGKKTLAREENKYKSTGFNCGRDIPEEDYFPSERNEKAKYSDQTEVSLNSRPNIQPVEITGAMSNTPNNPHEDFKANGYMKAQITKGNAKRGYFYTNQGEDAGSISAVVPNGSFLKTINEESESKPDIFTHTIYRLPTKEELIDVNSFNLSPEKIKNGFGYTIIGRGIKSKKNKEMIIQSISKLCDLFPENENYKKALGLVNEETNIVKKNLLNENVGQAKKILNTYNIPLNDTDYVAFKKQLIESNNIGYLGFIVKNVTNQNGFNLELANQWYQTIVNNRNIVNNLSRPLFEYTHLDDLLADINNTILLQNLKNFINKLSNRYLKDELSTITIDGIQNNSELLNNIKSFNESDKEMQYEFLRKTNKYDNISEFVEDFNDFCNSIDNKFDFETVKNKINSMDKDSIRILFAENNMIFSRIITYEASKEIGSKSWCIVGDESQFDNYVINENNYQYFLFNFNQETPSNEKMIAFTMNENNKITAAHDRYDTQFNEVIEYINKLGISQKIYSINSRLRAETIINKNNDSENEYYNLGNIYKDENGNIIDPASVGKSYRNNNDYLDRPSIYFLKMFNDLKNTGKEYKSHLDLIFNKAQNSKIVVNVTILSKKDGECISTNRETITENIIPYCLSNFDVLLERTYYDIKIDKNKFIEAIKNVYTSNIKLYPETKRSIAWFLKDNNVDILDITKQQKSKNGDDLTDMEFAMLKNKGENLTPIIQNKLAAIRRGENVNLSTTEINYAIDNGYKNIIAIYYKNMLPEFSTNQLDYDDLNIYKKLGLFDDIENIIYKKAKMYGEDNLNSIEQSVNQYAKMKYN